MGYPQTSNKVPRVAIEKSSGARTNFITHDWCDKTTWYSDSARIVDEIASDGGSHTLYNLAKTNVIDIYHGKLSDEDTLVDANGDTYRVTVKVNDIQKTEQDPHVGAGGDYTIDYAAGTVTFLSALAVEDVVKVTYYHAQSSVFIVKPKTGKRLLLEEAEVQFSDPITLNDSAIFETFGFVEAFAPHLLDTADPAGPYPAGTLIPIAKKVYKTMYDYINEATKGWPSYPKMGGANWRGLDDPLVVFTWDYDRHICLDSDTGMEIRIYLDHDEPFIGKAFATIYSVAEVI